MPSDGSSPRLLVLGATSKLWRLVLPNWRLVSQGVIDTLAVSRRAGEGVDLIWAPEDAVGKLPHCDAILSLWAVTSGVVEELARNEYLAKMTLEVAAATGARRIVHASSGAVYGRGDTPHHEDEALRGLNAYGQSKARAERILRAAPIPTFVLRLGNVAGADALFAAMSRPAPLEIDQFPDGRGPLRSYIAPDDLAQVFMEFLVRDPEKLPSCVNVAGPELVDMTDLARARGHPWAPRPVGDAGLAQHMLDTGRLRTLGLNLRNSSGASHLAGFEYPTASS